MLGVVEVRVEAVVSGLSRVGCTKLLRDSNQTMVEIALRDWPDDGSSHEVVAELVDPDTGEPWTRRDDGATGGPLHIGGGAFSGCAWFESRGTTDVRLRVRLGTELFIDTGVELVELPTSGDVDTADLPMWWQLRMAGDPPTWAMSEGFRSAPDGSIGHLLFL